MKSGLGWSARLAVLVLAAVPVRAQVVIDDFSVAQAALSVAVPPDAAGDSDFSAAVAGVGGERDVEVTLDGFVPPASTGTVTAEVTGGALAFNISTADTLGSALIAWDGVDGSASVDPVGISGPSVDLTVGGTQGALRLTVDSSSGDVQALLEVLTDADNRSRSVQILPAGPVDVFFDFAELVQSPGATGAADLTDIGAVTLRLIAQSAATASAVLSDLRTVPPQVSADKVDLDNLGAPIAAPVAPGDTLRYRITLDSSGGAENATLTDAIDPNLLPPGSFRSTPIARPDQYAGFGNVTLDSAATSRPALTANDNDPDGDAVTAVVAAAQATEKGGTVDVAANGSFVYVPPPGLRGVDCFTYMLVPVAGDPTHDAAGNPIAPAAARACVALDRSVWFVDNTHGGPFEGTQANPFDTLAAAEAASGPGDIIRVRQGDGTTAGHDAGIGLQAGQQLIGGGVALVVEGQTIEAADAGRPQITHGSGGHAIELDSQNVVHGVDVVNSDLSGLFGQNVGTVHVRAVSIANAGAEAIHIDGATLDVELDSVSSDGSPGDGLRLANVSGSLVVSGATMIADHTDAGILVESSPGAALDFGSVTTQGAGGMLRAGGESLGAPGTSHGIDLSTGNAGATFTFDALNVTTTDGKGLLANGSGTVNINSAAASISATGGEAVDITSTTGQTHGVAGWTFATLASADSLAAGVRLASLSDSFTVGTSTTVTDAETAGIHVTGSGGLAFSFGATSVTDSNVGTGANATGIDLFSGNTSSSFSFASLNVVTDGGFGMRVAASTVHVAGSGNSIAANRGAALDFFNTTLGGAGATFATLSSTNSTATGMSLVGVGGTLNATAGAISGSAGTAFHVDSGNPAVTYGGSVTQTGAARVVNVEDTTGNSVGFTGTVTGGASSLGVRIFSADGNVSFADLDLGTAGSPMTNTAVTLTGGSAGTMGFAGTQIFTNGATGLNANNGGTVEVTGPGNRIVTTGGSAVSMTNGTTIGGNGATFQEISTDASGGAISAIVLRSTGSGAFTVTGDGTTTAGGNGSGGTIKNVTDADAIVLDTTGGLVTLQNIFVEDVADPGDTTAAIQTRSFHDGIHGENVNGGLRLQSVTMRRFSDHAILGALFSDGTSFTSWTGLELRDSVFENSNRFHVAGRGDDGDEGMIRIRGLTGTVVVDNCTVRDGGRGLDIYTPAGAGTLDATIQRSTFEDIYKEFASGATVNIGGRGVSFEARGSHDMVVRIGDPAEANPALGNLFEDNMTASVVVLGQEGGTSPHTGDVDVVISRNTMRITDHSTSQATPPSFLFNFPQGGVSLNPSGGTFEGIVSNNLFDEVMHAAGGLGQLTIGHNTGNGDSEFIVRGNEFRRPWDMAMQVRAEGNNSMAILVENNTWTEGLVGGAGTDLGGLACGTGDPVGQCPAPFQGFEARVRNGGKMDLTVRNEVLPQHDDVNNNEATFIAEVQAQATNVLNLYIDDSKAPDSYRLTQAAGSFNLYREDNTDVTAADILDGNGNTGGNGTVAGGDINGDNTDPPVVSTAGTITASDTAPTLPSITIP